MAEFGRGDKGNEAGADGEGPSASERDGDQQGETDRSGGEPELEVSRDGGLPGAG